MEFVEKEKYLEWKGKQSDDYGLACLNYAEDWATLMEVKMSEGHELEDIAKDTSHEADVEGITGFMYNMAVAILVSHWVHGERLRRWHNLTSQLGDEGERANETGAILNTAVLNIGGASTEEFVEALEKTAKKLGHETTRDPEKIKRWLKDNEVP